MSFRLIEGESIDRKVASRQIFFQRNPKVDSVGTTLIAITALGAIGSYFNDRKRLVFRASFYSDSAIVVFVKRVRKYGLDLLWSGVGSDVPVFRSTPNEQV